MAAGRGSHGCSASLHAQIGRAMYFTRRNSPSLQRGLPPLLSIFASRGRPSHSISALPIERFAHFDAVWYRFSGKRRADHRSEWSAVDVQHHRGKHFPVAMSGAGKSRARDGHVLSKTWLGTQ
jgi:hypothetical protein